MTAPLVARIYDRLWRPLLVRIVTRVGVAVEDEILTRHLGRYPHLTLLDLCCGTARASRRWVLRGADVLGIDQSWAMLQEARRRCPSDRLLLLHGDSCEPLLRPGRFDAAICFASLHLLENPERLIQNAAAALHPGGLFFVWELVSSGILRSPTFQRHVMRPIGLRPFAPGSLRTLLLAHAFELLESKTNGAVEFVVCRRRESHGSRR
jgi:SAM-dependent methyltransferase